MEHPVTGLGGDDELKLSNTAGELGLDILYETHSIEEYKSAIAKDFNLIGINNRNLKTFDTDINHSAKIINKAGKPDNITVITESGSHVLPLSSSTRLCNTEALDTICSTSLTTKSSCDFSHRLYYTVKFVKVLLKIITNWIQKSQPFCLNRARRSSQHSI